MNASETAPWLAMFVSMFLHQLPTLVVALVGAIIAVLRWKQIPRAAPWALAGCGLAIGLCLGGPAVHAFVQYRMMQDEGRYLIAAFGVISLLSSVGFALSYVFLLIAVFAGRGRPVVPPPVQGAV